MNEESLRQRAKGYTREKILFSIVELIISVGVLLALLLSGLSFTFDSLARSLTSNLYLALLIFIFLIGLMEVILLFPVNFYSGFILEHKYSLSNQTLTKWFLEQIKGLAVGGVIFVPLLLLLYCFLRSFEKLWWVPTAGVILLVSVLLAKLGPVLILPIFYKFQPIDNEDLKQRLLGLCKRVKLRVQGVFVFNLSKDTKKANAGFTGLGRTRRIIISDTLLENFSPEEVTAIFAHELGHYRYRHLWKGILIGSLCTFLSLFIIGELYSRSLAAFGFRSPSQIGALPLLALYLLLFGFIIAPLQNSISRYYERQADCFSIEITKDKAAFISSMKKLAEINLANADPNPIIEFLFYNHPSIKKRIAFADNKSCEGSK